MEEKILLIESYLKTRPPENDTVSETYRGGANEKNYIPLDLKEIKKNWINYLEKNKFPLIDFYIHIPFCFKKCTYCFYYKEIYNNEKLEKYLEYLELYLKEFIQIFKGIKFKSLYIGGGTPTVLNEKQIFKLLSFIQNNFEFLSGAEKTFEGNPLSFSKNKIEIISEFGFNRISMGVQSIDEKVLKNSNREYQNISLIKNSIDNMYLYGIQNINIDLIMGLKDDNVEKFGLTLQKVIDMNPYNITIYWLGPTNSYLKEFYNGNIEDFFLDLNSKVEEYYNYLIKNKDNFKQNLVFEIDKKNGHVWTIKLKNNNFSHIKYEYNDFGDGSLFGVGPSSRSHINGYLVYKTLNDINYEKFNLLNIINIGNYIVIDDEISLYVITEIRDRVFIDEQIFYKKFLKKFSTIFAKEIKFLKNNNLIKIDNGKIYFNIDIDKKLYYSLFFISKENLLKKCIVNLENTIKIFFSKNDIKLNIILFYEKKINIITQVDYNYINSNNIKLLNLVLFELNKVIEILNKKQKNLIFGKTLIQKLLNNISKLG